MQGSISRLTVSLVLLSLGGVFAFSPLPEEVALKGHQILWVFEAAWFLWENRVRISELWSTAHRKMR
jgi:hypothetical protein